jgi:hypothetical protein
VFNVSLQNEIADTSLGGEVRDGAQESKAPTLTVDAVLPRGEHCVHRLGVPTR